MSPVIFGGSDALCFDMRLWDITLRDIKKVCAAFKISFPVQQVDEKGQELSHSSRIIYVESKQGRYVLKFYPRLPPHDRRTMSDVQTAWKLNHLLLTKDVPVPVMRPSKNDSPYVVSGKYIATCHDFLDGYPAYKKPLSAATIDSVVRTLHALQLALEKAPALTQSFQHPTWTERTRHLALYAHRLPRIRSVFTALSHAYSENKHLFVCRPVHTNLSLANLFFHKRRTFILDLGHIRMDQELSGLATLLVSCFFLKTPPANIKTLIERYFRSHQLNKEKMLVLNMLVQQELAHEYIKTIERQSALTKSPCVTKLEKTYLVEINKRMAFLERKLEPNSFDAGYRTIKLF